MPRHHTQSPQMPQLLTWVGSSEKGMWEKVFTRAGLVWLVVDAKYSHELFSM